MTQQRCCEYDYDGDGNCHIHSAPGVPRLKLSYVDEVLTEEQVKRMNDFLDKLIPLPPWGRSIISVYNGPHHTTDFYEYLKVKPKNESK